MLRNYYIYLFLLVVCYSCKNEKPKVIVYSQGNSQVIEKDSHSFSNSDEVSLKHLDLDIVVDMDKRLIRGSALWEISFPKNSKKKGKDVEELILDTYDLTIQGVFVDSTKVTFRLDTPTKYLGSALHIPIKSSAKTVKIWYQTGKNAHALQWLSPQQTNDKKFPFMFTQSESIYARSWIPCADGPGVRFTYNAKVTVPKGMLAVMSARNAQELNASGVYMFEMDQPIPAYLMALSVGNIAFAKIDKRTGVYAEPGMIKKAASEFRDIGKMVDVAEQLYGPYRWGRYDVLVLPPSFPIGGMENPRLTFCTPTIITGDRSLVSLIAHELAHSWSGNLVTNATWNDFWLNEGFTNYFERRIMEQMMGKNYADMLWKLGYQTLLDNVKELGDTSLDTRLKIELTGRDPDEGFTDIPYEKGSLFLRLIEEKAGRGRFDSFLTIYFNEHAFTSVTTEQFLAYLQSNLIKDDSSLKNKLAIDDWVNKPGVPANCPQFEPISFKFVERTMTEFPVPLNITKSWSTYEWLYYLQKLNISRSSDSMNRLDLMYNFSKTTNSEIAGLWFLMAVKNDYRKAFPQMEIFLSNVGRRKFIEPIYGELMRTGKDSTLARELFEKYKNNYHPLAQEALEKIIRINDTIKS